MSLIIDHFHRTYMRKIHACHKTFYPITIASFIDGTLKAIFPFEKLDNRVTVFQFMVWSHLKNMGIFESKN
jgi:hypothetical protein